MDPLTAVGLAGTIVQFVDFSSKLLLEGRELYKSGSAELNLQVEAATKDLLEFSIKLQRLVSDPDVNIQATDNVIALGKLCEECSELAYELLARLDQLKSNVDLPSSLSNDATKRDKQIWLIKLKDQKKRVERMGTSLRLAFRSMWSAEELKEISARLEKYRGAIHTRMVGLLMLVFDSFCHKT